MYRVTNIIKRGSLFRFPLKLKSCFFLQTQTFQTWFEHEQVVRKFVHFIAKQQMRSYFKSNNYLRFLVLGLVQVKT